MKSKSNPFAHNPRLIYSHWLMLLLAIFFWFPHNSFSQSVTWLSEIQTLDDFTMLSIPDTSRTDLLRTAKFLAPAQDDSTLLPTVFQNVNQYLLHFEFMANAFPERFGGLTMAEYMNLVMIPGKRTYFAGTLYQFQDKQGALQYGFDLFSTPTQSLNPAEISALYTRLLQSMKLRPFAYSPINPTDIEQAKRWENPGFPIYLPEGIIEPEYEAYSPGVNYGRVRRFTLEQLGKAEEAGQIGWQDIVVVDTAPTDITTVVAGIITGTRQGELSHVNVRSMRRGTPNAYMQNPLEVFKPYDGQLIKLTLKTDTYEITPSVPVSEAETWWNRHRPQLPAPTEPDDKTTAIIPLSELSKQGNADTLIRRYGGKSTQLGLLYSVMQDRVLSGEEIPFLVQGFAIPFHYYMEFIRTNYIPYPSQPNTAISYEMYLQFLMQDSQFQSDSAYRYAQLTYFVNYVLEHGTVNPELVNEIITQVQKVFGSASVKVKFRSSSNAEDNVAFNGAGLYDSTAVCVQDNLDGDEEGPSHCDPTQKKERTIERGLKKVWASLWNPQAYEERHYYQIYQPVRMGVLVSRAYPQEDCNGVAFTGDPANGRKDYYVINVQQGDESVVQPDIGVVPEKDLVDIDHSLVAKIHRIRGSSLLPKGAWILSDDQVNELAFYLTEIERLMPVDTAGYRRDQICFDIEFKYQDGQLVIKQIRPMLMATAITPIPVVEKVTLRIPENTAMISLYEVGRTIQQEYELHSMIYFKSGEYSLPLQSGLYDWDFIDRLEFGPQRSLAIPQSPGKLQVESFDPPENGVRFRYQFDETFTIADGKKSELHFQIQGLQILNENQTHYTLVLDKPLMVNQLAAQAYLKAASEEETTIRYSATAPDTAQIMLHELALEGNQTIKLYELIKRRTLGMGVVYANLGGADVKLFGKSWWESDYWNLIYSAQGHCWDAKFWVLFDQPQGEAYGAAVLTTTLQWGASTEAEAFLLDKNLQPLRKLNILSYSKNEIEKIPDPTTSIDAWWFY